MDWVARAIGAFYIFAGIVLLRAWIFDRFLDRAIEQLAGERPSAADQLRSWTMPVIGGLTLVSGALFLIPSRFAPYAFLACSAVQGAYLAWARTALPPGDAAEATGRRQSLNAFRLYLGATAFSLWMMQAGRLR